MQLLDAAELRRRLPMPAAIDALEAGFREQDPSVTPLRSHLETPAGSLLLMPAFGDGGRRREARDAHARQPGARAAVHRRGLRAVRCRDAGAGGDHRRRRADRAPDGRRVGAGHAPPAPPPTPRRSSIFGAGVQARSHLEAMRRRPPDRAGHGGVADARRAPRRWPSRSRGSGSTRPSAERTTSPTRIWSARARRATCRCSTAACSPPGAHVNAVGSYQPDGARAGHRAIVAGPGGRRDARGGVRRGGRAVIPIAEGAFGREHVVADLARGRARRRVRTSPRRRHGVQVRRAGVRGPDRGARGGGRGEDAMTATADVVVVGGGVVGASTAYHLAAAGVGRVVLLERADGVATGSTGACAGGFRHQFSSRINIELSLASVPMILGFTRGARAAARRRAGRVPVPRSGRAGWAEFRAGAELQRSLGVDTQLLTPEEAGGDRAGHRGRGPRRRDVLRRRRHRGSRRAHAGIRDARAARRRRRAAGRRRRRDRDGRRGRHRCPHRGRIDRRAASS